MRPEGLESVVEDGRVTALFEACQQFFEIAGGLIADLCEISNGKKFESGFSGVHESSSGRKSDRLRKAIDTHPHISRGRHCLGLARGKNVIAWGVPPDVPRQGREFRSHQK